MSFVDWFISKDYESYLYRENVKLKDENKRLKKENKSVWQQLNALSRMQNIQMLDPCSLPDSKAFQIILSNEQRKNRMLECELDHAHEEHRELKKKLNENKMLRTLEQYEKDERESISTIQIFTDLTRKQKNEIETLSKNNKELERELKIYKDFVASIMGILNEEKAGLRK